MKKKTMKGIMMLLLIGVTYFIYGKLQSVPEIEYKGEEKALENYRAIAQKEPVTEVSVSDRTGKYPKEQLSTLRDSIIPYLEQAFQVLMDYDGTDSEYAEHISNCFIQGERFPMVNADYTKQLVDYLQRHAVTMQYQAVTVSLIRVAEYEPEGTVITIRGYVTANIQSDLAEQGDYDTTFKMDIFLENEQYKMLSLELSKAFDRGLNAYWDNTAHTVIQYNGEFRFDWDVEEEVFFDEEEDFFDESQDRKGEHTIIADHMLFLSIPVYLWQVRIPRKVNPLSQSHFLILSW